MEMWVDFVQMCVYSMLTEAWFFFSESCLKCQGVLFLFFFFSGNGDLFFFGNGDGEVDLELG